MGLDPAMGGKVHGDAGGEQQDRDAERAGDPGKIDTTLEDEEVEDAEDQDQHGRLCEEGGTAPGGDDGQVEPGFGPGWGVGAVRGDEAQACGVWGGVGG